MHAADHVFCTCFALYTLPVQSSADSKRSSMVSSCSSSTSPVAVVQFVSDRTLSMSSIAPLTEHWTFSHVMNTAGPHPRRASALRLAGQHLALDELGWRRLCKSLWLGAPRPSSIVPADWYPLLAPRRLRCSTMRTSRGGSPRRRRRAPGDRPRAIKLAAFHYSGPSLSLGCADA